MSNETELTTQRASGAVDTTGLALAAPPTRAGSRRMKAIVAIVAGAALLLGGGTTLAYWSTTQSITGDTVSSGDLNLTLNDSPAWTLMPEGGAATPVPDITTVRIVPGDTVTLTQDATLTLVGDNIHAELDVAEGTVPAPLTATVSVSGVTDPADLTATDDGSTVTVSVEFEFPNTITDRNNVNTAFDLTDVQLTLTQITP